MAARIVQCAKLGRELPGLDEDTPTGARALRMAVLFGGPALKQRVHEQVSAEAWQLWLDRMLLVVNEFRLDPTADASNPVLREHLEAFLFGGGKHVPNYRPPA
jgi:Fe-S cluster biosynthesis and repair protein YggX